MIAFAKEAFRNIRQTGSIMESSVYLSRKMISIIDFKRNIHIVELGAGTGSITKVILNNMNRQSRITSFEINENLYDRQGCNISDRRLTRINDDVGNIGNYLEKESIDYIISALPLAVIPPRQKLKTLKECNKVLKCGGYYVQFQYSKNDLKLLKKNFSSVDLGFTLFNLPPAFIYYAAKKKLQS